MKTFNFFTMALITILIATITACGKDDPKEEYNYSYKNDYIRDTILDNIDLGTLGTKHLFIINENRISESGINTKISSIKKEDIISITIINKTEAEKIFGSSIKDGAVKINYYIDPLLKPEYYVTTNTEIMNKINDLISQNKVVRYPLIVIDGKPLRGTEIKENLNNLNNELIKTISVMNLQSGLQLYGERAINGVVLINTL